MLNIRYDAQLCAVGGRAEPSGRRGPEGGLLSDCVASRLPSVSADSENAGVATMVTLLHLTLLMANANAAEERGEDEAAADATDTMQHSRARASRVRRQWTVRRRGGGGDRRSSSRPFAAAALCVCADLHGIRGWLWLRG